MTQQEDKAGPTSRQRTRLNRIIQHAIREMKVGARLNCHCGMALENVERVVHDYTTDLI